MQLSRGLYRLRELRRIALGRLRARLLSVKGARVGRKVVVGKGCEIDRAWCLHLGDGVCLEDGVSIKVVADDARVVIGSYSFLGRGTQIDAIAEVSIGEHAVIAPRCFIVDHDHGLRADLRIDQQPCAPRPIAIGDDVWIGTAVAVLAGSTIGQSAVVGANAVVKGHVAARSIVAGIPARFVRMRDEPSTPLGVGVERTSVESRS